MTNINIQASVLDDYQRFKKLLEYFVAYLEYCHHNSKEETHNKTDTQGFDEYIRPNLPDKIKWSGQGWNGHEIQNPISQWDEYNGSKIYITADARSDYTTKSNYLTWHDTAYNIIAQQWNNGKIITLKQVSQNICNGFISDTKNLSEEVSIGDLGLFDGKNPNEALKRFYINYYKEFNNQIYQKLLSQMEVEEYIKILEKNHNIVLTGAPGTGKTYLAKKMAHVMNAKIEMVQFHPSYDYTDFVEGLRPTPPDDNGNIGFKRTSGVFWNFCEKALTQTSQKFVFIIDEINRGELSKIFGELFFSIDPGYRGINGAVKTQYSNMHELDNTFDKVLHQSECAENYPGSGWFFVPDNVYIIGIMNDIDRSVESMDFAMRRRFAWKEITAESRQSMLDDEGAWADNKKPEQKVIDEIKVRMNNLNACIIDKYNNDKDKVGLTKAYQIGASYFLKYNGNFDDLWYNHLEGLLYEYLRGTTNIDIKIERLHAAYNDTVAH